MRAWFDAASVDGRSKFRIYFAIRNFTQILRGLNRFPRAERVWGCPLNKAGPKVFPHARGCRAWLSSAPGPPSACSKFARSTPLPAAVVPRRGSADGADLLQSVWHGATPIQFFIWEVSAMSHAKQASKRRSRTKAVTVLGVAWALSLAGGASEAAVGPPGDTRSENPPPVITLGEEEISDVTLATFYVFDNENAGAHRPGLQLAKRTRGHGGCAVHRGCGGCAVACGGCGGCASCASAGGPDGQ
jgi:hypothetical protein